LLLQQCTWPEVEAYLKRSTAIILPTGATEQHGPAGVMGVDTYCAETIARGVGEAAGVMVGPTLTVGMSEHHMRFPGSMTLRPSTLVMVMRDWLVSLAAHGFRRVLVVNGHGGNMASLQAGFAEAYNELRQPNPADTPDLRCKAVNWWQQEPVTALGAELFPGDAGRHASPTEVAVAQYAAPDTVKSVSLDPETPPVGPIYGPDSFRAMYPDGRIGSNSALATPEAGKRLCEVAVQCIVEDLKSFLAEA